MTVTETEASTETEAVASVPASDGTDDSKARRGKGELEAQVRAITDAFVRGVLYEHPGDQPLTPHMISTYIKNRFGLDKAPSAGAISANLNRWEEVYHLEQQDNWDKVRLSDSSIVWVQSKHLVFAKPADLDKPNAAEVTIMAFYEAVVRKDYAAAYSYLAGPWKAQLSFADFVNGYSSTNSLSTEIRQVIPMGDGRFQVDVAMKALEGTQQVPYMGSYLVEKIGDEWFLSAGSLTITGGPRADPRLPGVRVPLVETPSAPSTATPELPPPIDEEMPPESVPEETH